MNGNKIGIIAGEGDFPFLVAQGAQDLGYDPYIVAFKGHTREEICALAKDIIWIHVGQLGKLINFFKKNGVKELIFAGAINKPKALNIRPDFKAAMLLFKLRAHSDNEILEGIVNYLTQEGFNIVPPSKFVPSLIMPKGILTNRKPNKSEIEDIKYGWPIAKKIGEMDIGQTIVTKQKMVVAVEAMEGTNATIQRAGTLVNKDFVVIKIFKPNQSPVVDQPSIGLKTIETMIHAGGRCLVVEAKKSLFFEQDSAIELANKHDISIIGVENPLEEL